MQIFKVAVFLTYLLSCPYSLRGTLQTPLSMRDLLKQLEQEDTTDNAAQEFLKIGTNDTAAKKFLTANLPALLRREPKDHPRAWINSAKLAGAFRIVEAAPLLAKWIGVPMSESGSGTIAETQRLDPFPAGRALVQIGEPALPTLVGILRSGDSRERWVAYRSVFLIGTPPALAILKDHVSKETDQQLRSEIERALSLPAAAQK